MRPLSVDEIDGVLRALGLYLGKRLQTVVTSENDVILGFWEGRRLLWLWMDLRPNAPVVLPFVDLPFQPASKSTPLHLFLRAHFVGRELLEIERVVDAGRVVRLIFEGAEIEVRLLPKNANLVAQADAKQVSLRPVRELAVHEESGPRRQARSLSELVTEWRAAGQPTRSKISPKAGLEKRLASLRRSQEKVGQEIVAKEQSPWRRLGEWLIAHQSLDVPEEFAAIVDRRRKLSWNIEQCFQKAKEMEAKLAGTRARARELEAECARVLERLQSGDWLESKDKPKLTLAKGSSARTLHLTGDLHVVVGKSARDNLDLLRQAHPWDLWLHIKDQPGAHAVLFRPKGTAVSDEKMQQAGQWLLRMSLGPKYKSHDGEKFEILTAECRFVSPIKGDRMGRVTYRNERVLRIKFNAG